MSWFSGYGVDYKTMAFRNGGFPCCMQIALHYLGRAGANDAIETEWDRLLKACGGPGLADRALSGGDIARIYPQTRSTKNTYLIGPETFHRDGGAAVEAMLAGFEKGEYRALVLGDRQARVFIRKSAGDYVAVKVGPSLADTAVHNEKAIAVGISVHSREIFLRGRSNGDMACSGNYAVLMH